MKDFTKKIQELRDEMHKEIIMEVIQRTKNEDSFELTLNNPFYTYAYDWDGDYQVQVAVTGIEGGTNRLITECITDGSVSENVDYQDLQFGELDYLYKQIVNDLFTINVI